MRSVPVAWFFIAEVAEERPGPQKKLQENFRVLGCSFRVFCVPFSTGGAVPGAYFAVGITNSAPLPIDSGQRCMIDFCLV
jgi:hypothetical protein